MIKQVLAGFVFLSLASTVIASPIPSAKAAFHVGEDVMVCGDVKDVKILKMRTVMNLGKKYPHEDLSILIWDTDAEPFRNKFGDLRKFYGKRVCVQGTIETYRDHLQIKATNPTLLRLMK